MIVLPNPYKYPYIFGNIYKGLWSEMTKTYKGIYKPTNPKKYAGDPTNIVYRSNWERRFMVYCDKNDDIIYWASEELPIPYYNPVTKKVHRYFPDFIIKTSKGKRFMIEIKPAKYLKPPKPQAKRTKRFFGEQVEFIKNQAKWKAASAYCEDQNMEFKVFTEKELGIY